MFCLSDITAPINTITNKTADIFFAIGSKDIVAFEKYFRNNIPIITGIVTIRNIFLATPNIENSLLVFVLIKNSSEKNTINGIVNTQSKLIIAVSDIERATSPFANEVNILEVAPDLKNRVLTVNGVSKSHAMTGWRIGYAGGPLDLIGAMTKLQGQSTTNPSSVGQAAALAALNGSKDIIKEWNKVYTKRKILVQEKLSKINSLTFLNPEGAFYFFIDCTGLIGKSTLSGLILKSDIDICMYLLEHAQVALVPGSEFGMPNFLRLCFAKSDKILVEACNRIEKSIYALNT